MYVSEAREDLPSITIPNSRAVFKQELMLHVSAARGGVRVLNFVACKRNKMCWHAA